MTHPRRTIYRKTDHHVAFNFITAVPGLSGFNLTNDWSTNLKPYISEMVHHSDLTLKPNWYRIQHMVEQNMTAETAAMQSAYTLNAGVIFASKSGYLAKNFVDINPK